jgi:hypothetical protein
MAEQPPLSHPRRHATSAATPAPRTRTPMRHSDNTGTPLSAAGVLSQAVSLAVKCVQGAGRGKAVADFHRNHAATARSGSAQNFFRRPLECDSRNTARLPIFHSHREPCRLPTGSVSPPGLTIEHAAEPCRRQARQSPGRAFCQPCMSTRRCGLGSAVILRNRDLGWYGWAGVLPCLRYLHQRCSGTHDRSCGRTQGHGPSR